MIFRSGEVLITQHAVQVEPNRPRSDDQDAASIGSRAADRQVEDVAGRSGDDPARKARTTAVAVGTDRARRGRRETQTHTGLVAKRSTRVLADGNVRAQLDDEAAVLVDVFLRDEVSPSISIQLLLEEPAIGLRRAPLISGVLAQENPLGAAGSTTSAAGGIFAGTRANSS